jgi:hypothetical protein
MVTHDDLQENMHGALKFFLAHLNGLRHEQWDWAPSPACRSIRQILQHLCETYPDKADLEEELARPVPEVARVQALFAAAARQDYAALCRRYADIPLDTEMEIPEGDWFSGRGQVKAGTLLGRRTWEECYHTGQIVLLRLATDPDWALEESVYGGTFPAARETQTAVGNLSSMV